MEKQKKSNIFKENMWTFSIVGVMVFTIISILLLNQKPNYIENIPFEKRIEMDLTKGNENSKNELIKYFDLQCPACAASNPFVEKALEDNKDDLKVTYSHFPLRQIHPIAEKAHMAIECVLDVENNKDKVFELINIFYENQRSLNSNSISRLSYSVGVNEEEFDNCLKSGVKKKVVDYYIKNAPSDVRGTPTFYLNGVRIENSQIANLQLENSSN